MDAARLWVQQGTFRNEPPPCNNAQSEDRKFLERGDVRLTAGANGTEVKWHVQAPNISSLFVVIDWLSKARAPFALRFYLSGWFEEFYQSAGEAAQRIEAIISRGDRHFPTKTFVDKVEVREDALSGLIQTCLSKSDLPDDFSVDCTLDQNTERFIVSRVGRKSLMSKLYGEADHSFAHQSIGSFSDTVSESYREVLNTGIQRTDHVLAALRLSNNQVHWVPYHRLIVPIKNADKTIGVKVVADAAKIGFRIIWPSPWF